MSRSFSRKPFVFFAIFVALLSPLTVSQSAWASSVSDYNNQVAAQKARIKDLQSQLDSANKVLADLQSNSNGQANLINAAQTAATQAKDALDAAAADYQVKQNAYDVAFQDEQNAESAVNQAVAAVNSAADNVDSSFNAYQSALDAVDSASAAVQTAQNDYDTKLISVGGQASPGLIADVYTGVYKNGNPPTRSDNAYTKCKTTTVSNIQADWGGGDILGCGSDYVMIHYHGFITYPSDKKVYFYAQADDGFFMTINGQPMINDWALKGCGGNSAGLFSFSANVSYAVDAWFYEWGGGACSTLYYQPQGLGQWSVAPASFFSQQAVASAKKDPALKVILDQKTAIYVQAVANAESALADYNSAGDASDAATTAYGVANDGLVAKQSVLAQADAVLAGAESVWQSASDDSAVKNADLLSLQTQYKATFDSITKQGDVVNGLEIQVSQAEAALAAIPKPVAPGKVVKKVVSKPVPPTKLTPKGKFVPNPKQ